MNMAAFGLKRRDLLGGLAFAPLFASDGRAADPKVLIGVIEEDPPLINPAITSIISSYAAGSLVYSGLVWTDADGKLWPDLAERWETSPDGQTFTFHLREGVLWHDGHKFTAEDVKFSLEQLTAKLHPSAKGAYKALDGIDTPDERTAIIRMKHPVAAFMNVPTALWPILPRHLWEGTEIFKNPYNSKPVGTGPFKFAERTAGERIRYLRNEHYHIPGRPMFDEFVLRIMPDASARVSAFEKGEIDVMFSTAVPATEIPRLAKMPGTELRSTSIPGGAWIGNINTRNPRYGDVRVRHALAHAIDRRFIRDNVLPGISRNMVGPLPPSSPLYNTALVDYEFDPARANAILDAAGYARDANGTRFEFRFLWAGGDIRVTKMGDVLAQNLAAVGIKVILRPLERSSLNQLGYIGGQFDMIIDSFSLGPDPDIGVERLYNSNNILPVPFVNNSGYANPEVDKMFDEQRVQIDPIKRKAIYDRIQEIIWADIPVFPICAYSGPAVARGSYVADAFTCWNTVTEDFAHARPVGG
jgi:peptide/nickel transport system substrate-binding protein